MDLENRNASLLEELSSTTPLSRRSASLTDWLPRAPARHSLSGHRSPITKVSFHPLYSVLATASEDASVKIWDWESGELERTVKGHTKAVMDVEFDKKGETMGELDVASFAFFSRSSFGSKSERDGEADLTILVPPIQSPAPPTLPSNSGTRRTSTRTSRPSTDTITPSRVLGSFQPETSSFRLVEIGRSRSGRLLLGESSLLSNLTRPDSRVEGICRADSSRSGSAFGLGMWLIQILRQDLPGSLGVGSVGNS